MSPSDHGFDENNGNALYIDSGEGWWFSVMAGSRKRFITPESDNFGFARWVWENGEQLLRLGPGVHYGEWWGSGIQRGYGLEEKRFSLFNTKRWNDGDIDCCSVVPVLYEGIFDEHEIEKSLYYLRKEGSRAADFDSPEGIMIYHTAANSYFKCTLEDDHKPKGQVA